MPKKKRDKKVSLTKTAKKPLKEMKGKLIARLQEYVKKFKSIYVFTFLNLRNNTLKEIKKQWRPGHIIIGKNRVMALALGKTEDKELEKDLHKLSELINGQCGLLLTNCKKQEVIDWFETYTFEEYARTGYKTEQTVKLKEGPLEEFAHSQEPYLRKLGMPVKLHKGVVTLIEDYTVCKAGQILTSQQAKILELLDRRTATFKLTLKAHWSKKGGFNKLASPENSEDEGDKSMELDSTADDSE